MRTPSPNPVENLLAVEVHAPKLWVASARLNGRAAAELFPLDGGASSVWNGFMTCRYAPTGGLATFCPGCAALALR